MAIMKCLGNGCDANIPITSENCPSCGFRLQNYFQNEMAEFIVGIPICPLEYWNEHHIWYWDSSRYSEIEFTDKEWVERGDILMKLETIDIRSPFSGLVISNDGGYGEHRQNIQVSTHYKSNKFIEILIPKNEFYEEIGHIYLSLFHYIEKIAKENAPGSLGAWKTHHWFIGDLLPGKSGIDLDPKECFPSYEALLEKAHDLGNIRAIKMPLHKIS